MKKLITITLLLLVVLACKKEKNPIKEVKKGFENVQQTLDITKKFEKTTKRLSNLTPLSKEDIKSWMPENLDSLKRTKYEIGKQMGFAKISNVHLTFKNKKNKKIQLSITDGAGNGASIITMFNLTSQQDLDSESETGYKKTKTFNGIKVLVDYSNPKYANRSLFKYLINERLYVEARGWQMKPDELWKYLKKLEIEKLIK
jgi:PBP1b-binding outer membrane lipoprotein LpoB